VVRCHRRSIGRFIPININISSTDAGGANPDQHIIIIPYPGNRNIPYFVLSFPPAVFTSPFIGIRQPFLPPVNRSRLMAIIIIDPTATVCQ
jgi:hypothetical protein